MAPTLPELRAAVDEELYRFLEAKRAEVPETGPLIDEIASLVRAGGKRLRPCFCYWGFRAGGGAHGEEIVRAAASLELLHTFAIVHDDVMDRTEQRRGRPTTHVVHGESVAILVGDLALVLADAAFMSSGFSPSELMKAFGPYSRMRQEVIGGQYLDVVDQSGEPDEALARRIAVLKSGRYSIEEPLAIGAALAGDTEGVVDSLLAFGEPLGEAFQLRDDLLGMFGDESETGKPVDSDMREGKRHLLWAKTASGLRGPERDWFLERWGGGEELTVDEVQRLRAVVESSGARAATESLLADLSIRADAALDEIDAPEEARAALATLARLCIDRAS